MLIKQSQSTKNCAELQKFLHIFVDGEFGGGEEQEVQRHLSQCADCRAEVERIADFKKRTQKALQPKEAPGALRAKIEASMKKEAKAQQKTRWWLLAPIAAAIVGVVAYAAPLFYAPEADEVIATSVERHKHQLPIEIPGPSTDRVSLWFQGKVGFPVRVPRFPEGTHLLGGRLSAVNEDMAAHLTFERRGRKITVLIFDPERVPLERSLPVLSPNKVKINNRDVYLSRTRGYQVALFEDGGIGYTITADITDEDLAEIVASGFQP